MVMYGAETSPLQFSRVSFSKPSVDRVGAGEERMWGGGLYGRPPFCAPTAGQPQGSPLLCYGLAHEGCVWISTHHRAKTRDIVPVKFVPIRWRDFAYIS